MNQLSNHSLNTEPTQLPTLNEKGGIAIPALLWFAGVPLTLVVVLWLLFFRG